MTTAHDHHELAGGHDTREVSEQAEISGRPNLRVLTGGRAARSPRQMALPLQWTTSGVPATPIAPGYLRVVRDQEERAELAGAAAGRPNPTAWTAQIARAIFEVAQGERPASQLKKHVARDQLAALAIRGTSYARHPAARSAHGVARLRQVRAVRCCLVAPGVIEASAVLVGAARSHAVALRLEAQPESWLVTAVELR